jgi:hypothetical protein
MAHLRRVIYFATTELLYLKEIKKMDSFVCEVVQENALRKLL